MDPEIAVFPSCRKARRSGVRPLQSHAHAGPLHGPRRRVLASREPCDAVGRRGGAAGRDRRPGRIRVYANAHAAGHGEVRGQGVQVCAPHDSGRRHHQRPGPPPPRGRSLLALALRLGRPLLCKGVAVNAGLDVIVREPDVSPLQLQGPKSKDVMVALFGEEILDLEYYHLRETELDGIPLVITRTGWSAERGYELYLRASQFGDRLWDAVMAAGAKHDIRPIAPSEIRRIEAGIPDHTLRHMPDDQPCDIGLGWTVDEDKKLDYLGKAALSPIKEEG